MEPQKTVSAYLWRSRCSCGGHCQHARRVALQGGAAAKHQILGRQALREDSIWLPRDSPEGLGCGLGDAIVSMPRSTQLFVSQQKQPGFTHFTTQLSTRSGANMSWEKSATEAVQISGGSTVLSIPTVTIPQHPALAYSTPSLEPDPG